MRLLHRSDTGAISLTEDIVKNIPRHAILSHRWGAEEVTFQELADGTGLSKRGYDKIRSCAEQAWRDGLSYFWVDTCCIDKRNAVELQEAINSMFRWYRNAARCYVYLDDVSYATAQSESPGAPPQEKRKGTDARDCHAVQPTGQPWQSAFQKSLWFTRGWTLQELLAPASVEFFSTEGTLLGNKASLEQSICDVTRIPAEALRGSQLSDVWAASQAGAVMPSYTSRACGLKGGAGTRQGRIIVSRVQPAPTSSDLVDTRFKWHSVTRSRREGCDQCEAVSDKAEEQESSAYHNWRLLPGWLGPRWWSRGGRWRRKL